MKLSAILADVDVVDVYGSTDRIIDSVTRDSRKIGVHTLFVAIRGANTDGHQFVFGCGAPVVVVEERLPVPDGTTVVVVKNTKSALGLLAAALYGHPCRSMKMVGVTGTNGKTTVTHLVAASWQLLGGCAGRIGTTGNAINGVERPASFTTPEAPELQGLLFEMREQGCDLVAMEVSSIGLHQHRVDGCCFDVGVFTNLTQDHLDYHKTMLAYGEAKGRLFTHLLKQRPGVRSLSYQGATVPSSWSFPEVHWRYGEEGELSWSEVRLDSQGIQAQVADPSGAVFFLHSSMIGEHNLQNLVAAYGVLRALGVPGEAAMKALSQAGGVPGRMERIDDSERLIVVDYAHSDDALAHAIETLRPLVAGEIWVVFGCGGDRDRTKRPKMAQVASELADRLVITSDNPRSEPPEQIISEIVEGITPNQCVWVSIPERRDAVSFALAHSKPSDAVLIAGKGHEKTQEILGVKYPFDDRVVVEQCLLEQKNEV